MPKFNTLKEILEHSDWSRTTAARVAEMLEICTAMFSYTQAVLLAGTGGEGVQSNVYDRDKRINIIEREVRRSVVIHLSLETDRSDMPAALAFMNMVKDAERIGDYIKNMYDVTRDMQPDGLDRELHDTYLAEPAETLRSMFGHIPSAFLENDEEACHTLIELARKTGLDTEGAIVEISRGGLPRPAAVSLVLLLRFYKRIAMHMSNIASTVVMPVELMDFFDEPGD